MFGRTSAATFLNLVRVHLADEQVMSREVAMRKVLPTLTCRRLVR